METIKLLSAVALLVDIPMHGLVRGQVGMVVKVLTPDVYVVEFSDDSGRADAILTLPSMQLVPLQFHAVAA